MTALDASIARPPLTIIILAAGEGSRMKSPALPKVLHSFAGRSMLAHVLAATAGLAAERTAVVIGHRRDEVAAELALLDPSAVPVVQEQQNGTGHAVRIALQQLAADRPVTGAVLVLPGDAPLLSAATLADLLDSHAASAAAATLLTSELADPTGYGRVLRSDDPARPASVARVVEHKDASPDELAVTEVSAGVYAFDAGPLSQAVGRLSTDNAQGEEYLPEVVSIFVAQGLDVRARPAPAEETAGVNDRLQLAAAHRSYNQRLLERHMRDGVRVIDPATCWVDAEVTLAPDVTLKPNVQLHGATRISAGAVIGPDSTLTDTVVGAGSVLTRTVANQARIGAGVTVGPFAYLRPGAELADQVHIGTYVEIKGSDIGVGSKVPHLSYVGDASIGANTNIGAATVFVNYDGVAKHRSTIGDHARTGADNMFVAPVNVGDGAYTAAGSVITSDVPPGDLGVSRTPQRNVAGWVLRRRAGTASAAAAEAAMSSDPAVTGTPAPDQDSPSSTSGSSKA
ncbi:MAG TPA: bifunctional UDP-N-acetylglucosamine diphosphorylase/glucosamine-1-phosphate N-acetyltransferase GlmU [Jatrophihabitans sp.]|uniref:bifunctional UDP-N-acetylglucosamine diphosphorylase/glucosamine-1-phosphate N-acetyltransferase GlmU n=1 Tax=Jatrophihabitans sp. TaxID=1932789 RepID=UPI002F0785E8